MKWAKALTFLHGKAQRAAEKGKEAAWQCYLQDSKTGKHNIAEGRHGEVGQRDIFSLAKELSLKGVTTGV